MRSARDGNHLHTGSNRLEVIEMFRLAADRGVPIFVHVRSAGRLEPGSSIEAVGEVIGAAAITGASCTSFTSTAPG